MQVFISTAVGLKTSLIPAAHLSASRQNFNVCQLDCVALNILVEVLVLFPWK